MHPAMHRTDCVLDVTRAVRNKCASKEQAQTIAEDSSSSSGSGGVGNGDRSGRSQEQEGGGDADAEDKDEEEDGDGRLAQKPAQRCEVCEGKDDGIGGDPHFCANTFKYVDEAHVVNSESASEWCGMCGTKKITNAIRFSGFISNKK